MQSYIVAFGLKDLINPVYKIAYRFLDSKLKDVNLNEFSFWGCFSPSISPSMFGHFKDFSWCIPLSLDISAFIDVDWADTISVLIVFFLGTNIVNCYCGKHNVVSCGSIESEYFV